MRWKDRRESENVEDRRGQGSRGGRVALGGGATLIIALIVVLMGGDPSALLDAAGSGPTGSTATAPGPEEEARRKFVSVTLADTEEVWNNLFQRMGRDYPEPKLVLFSGQVDSACGTASSAVGPFYCGLDRNVYIDLGFYDQLRDQLGAKGDFAQAYVIAHEVGHHVQQVLGTLDKVNAQRKRASEREANRLSVRLELQADYYAGVWAHHAQQMAGIDRRDIEEAIEAAGAIGDDTLQRQSQGQVVPDAFTHGTSEQRIRWFRKGWESGRVESGDTFRVSERQL